MHRMKEEVILKILAQESLRLEFWLKRYGILMFQLFLWNFQRLRTFLELFFKIQGPNYEIRDYGLIFESPRGFFAKLSGIIDFGIIFVRKNTWTRSTGRGPCLASIHGGPWQCGRERGGAPAEARCAGAMTHRRLLRGAEEGEGDGGKAAVMTARGGGVLWGERGGKEGGVGCCEMRCSRGDFYRCRGGGRRTKGGGVSRGGSARVSRRRRHHGQAAGGGRRSGWGLCVSEGEGGRRAGLSRSGGQGPRGVRGGGAGWLKPKA
jgi:hypothetical protein